MAGQMCASSSLRAAIATAISTALLAIAPLEGASQEGASTTWNVHRIELTDRFIDPPLLEIGDSTLAVPTWRGIELFRRDSGLWKRCGIVGERPETEGSGNLAHLRGPDGSVWLRPRALALTQSSLAIVNSHPRMGEAYQAREHLEVLERSGEGCSFEWDGRSLWTGSAGMSMVHVTGLTADRDRILLGDSQRGVVHVYQRSPIGWRSKDELRPRGLGGEIPTSRRGRFGEGLAILRTKDSSIQLAVGEAHDDESLPASGTVYVYDDVGEVILREKLYPTDSRPGDRFGFDLEWQGEVLRSYNHFFLRRSSEGRFAPMDGSPLLPSRLPENRAISSVAWSGDLAVVGAPTSFDRRKGREYFEANPGRIFVFQRVGTRWQEIPSQPPTAAGASHRFGAVVRVSEGQIFVSDSETQSVYVVERVPERRDRLPTRPPSKEPQ